MKDTESRQGQPAVEKDAADEADDEDDQRGDDKETIGDDRETILGGGETVADVEEAKPTPVDIGGCL